ncbi:MAG: type II toxin-antitoxin system HipA family toxin [Sphaerotilus sulfidivorans]|uniref:type II toxin-antitoxin system HipA family toxin n=1 Tax=Sphaerotilus sulfidivorans TaxID=639200 RepID=UPI003F2C074D
MYTPVNVIQVYAWGEFVGALALDPRLGFYAFEYDPRWLRTGRELAPLQMPGSASPYVFPSLPVETFQRLPALLADALPDRFGNALIDAYLAGKGVDKSRITAIDRLAYMGERSMGALSFKPTRGPRKLKPTAVEVSQLVGAARAALQGQFGDDRQTEAALTQLIHVGTSAGGARAKAVVALHPVTGELRSGQLPADPGFEHWLLKFDGVGMDHELGTGGHYGRIEYAYHLMARSAGIDMPDCRLLEENGRAHFMIKRFDRDAASDKLHMQTLCAMDHLDYNQRGTHDYAQLFQVIDRLRLGPATRAEAFRRMVFNVVAANCDDHTKNHSFLMDRAGQWRLSPAYDVTHAYNPQGAWTHQHLMSVNGRFSGITRQDCLAVADRFLVPDPKAVLRQVAEAVRQWPVFAQQAGLPVEETRRVEQDFLALV